MQISDQCFHTGKVNALNALREASSVYLCLGGTSFACGLSANLQSLAPESSLQPVSMGLPCWLYTVTSCLEKVTVQSASQMGPRPTSVCLKDGMTCPVVGKSLACCGIGRLAVATECSTWPFAVPTRTCGAVVVASSYGALGAM